MIVIQILNYLQWHYNLSREAHVSCLNIKKKNKKQKIGVFDFAYFKKTNTYFCPLSEKASKKKRKTDYFSKNNPNQTCTRILFAYGKWFSSPNFYHPMSKIRHQPRSKYRCHFIYFEGWEIITENKEKVETDGNYCSYQTWKCELLKQQLIWRNKGTMHLWNSAGWVASKTSSSSPMNITSLELFVMGQYFNNPRITVSASLQSFSTNCVMQ